MNEGQPRDMADAGTTETLPDSARLTSGEVAEGVLELVGLAVRYLTVDQRGRTSLDEKDAEILESTIRSLARQKLAFAAQTVGQKVPLLTPDMQALGWIRHAFDDLCGYAADVPMSDARDRTLADHLSQLFMSSPRFGVNLEQVIDAMKAVREAAFAPRSCEDAEPVSDWLRGASPKDERHSPVYAAGELLREVMERCATPIEATFSRSTTEKYAQKVLVQLRAQAVRRVTTLQRLAYLMTVFGVAMDDITRVSFQVARLIVGGRLAGSQPLTEGSLDVISPRPPETYRLLTLEQKRNIVESMHQELVQAGVPEHRLMDAESRDRIRAWGYPVDAATGSRLWSVIDAFIGEPTVWAGGEVGQTSGRPEPVANPWQVG